MRIWLVDTFSSQPYDSDIASQRALGGTESTIVKIAEGLAALGRYQVAVVQTCRQQAAVSHAGVHYVASYAGAEQAVGVPDNLVVVRKAKLVKGLHKQYPSARLFLWLHNFQRLEALKYRSRLLAAGAQVLCVSDNHRQQADWVFNRNPLAWCFRLFSLGAKLPIRRIYNPVDDRLVADDSVVDRNKLVFFSSPDKGLSQVLERFSHLRHSCPDWHLYIANPGYSGDRASKLAAASDGVSILGALPQQVALQHVREAFAVFYPQSVHPETFGLVYAEANAVGTPVLAHKFGSASELLSAEQLVNADDLTQVIAKMTAWREQGRPKVGLGEQFRLQNVIQSWQALLGNP